MKVRKKNRESFLTSTKSDEEKYNRTISLLNDGNSRFETSDQHDVVIVLGNTKVGKSIVTQLISDNQNNLISKCKNGKCSIKEINELSSSESRSIYAELIVSPETKYPFYNCPGFNDKRNSSIDITATFQIKKVLESVEKVKFLFAVDFQSVNEGDDMSNIKQMLSNAVNLIKNLEKYKESIALVVTKVDNEKKNQDYISDHKVIINIIDYFKRVKASIKLDSDNSNNDEEKLHFSNINDRVYARIALSRRPDKSGQLENIQVIQDSIKSIKFVLHEKIKYVQTEILDFNYVLLDTTKKDITGLAYKINEFIVSKVKKIKTEIINHFNYLEEHISDISVLKYRFTSGYSQLSEIIATFNKWTTPKDIIKGSILFAYKLNILISEKNLLQILYYGDYLTFLKIANDYQIQENPFEWFKPLQGSANFLNTSKNWNEFLISLNRCLSEYETQSNKHNFDIKSFQRRLDKWIKQQDEIKVNLIQEFLDIVKIKVPEFDDIKDKKVDYLKLIFLKNIIDSTLDSKVNKTCIEHNKLQIEGNVILIKHDFEDSMIESFCPEKISEISLFATNAIFIDKDIVYAGMKLQLSMIAPDIKVYGDRNFTINGTAGESHSSEHANKGKSGKPGYPGISSGNLLIISNYFEGGNRLKVYANGGNGGPGQHGGVGIVGVNATVPSSDTYERSKRVYNAKEFICKWFGCYWFEIHYTKYFGKIGKVGGKGGDGGAVGEAGYGGLVEILIFDNANIGYENASILNSNGKLGTIGYGGEGGVGGYGYVCLYKCESGDCDYQATYFYLKASCGKSGRDNANKQGLIKSNKTIENFPLIVENYKNILRENIQKNYNQKSLLEFLGSINTNHKLFSYYSTKNLIAEMNYLENQYYKLKDNFDFIPSYEFLFDKIVEYANNPRGNEKSLQYKKVLAFLYTATLSKVNRMKHKVETNLIIDLKIYLELAEINIKKLQELSNQAAIDEYKKEYEDEVNKKIDEAYNIINNEIVPEIERLLAELDKTILKLVDEIIKLQEEAAAYLDEMRKLEKKLEKQLFMKAILGVLKIVGFVLLFFGPLAQLAGAAIIAGAEIAEGLTLEDPDEEKPPFVIPPGIQNALTKAAEKLKEDIQIFYTSLAELADEIKDGKDSHKSVSNLYEDLVKICETIKNALESEDGMTLADIVDNGFTKLKTSLSENSKLLKEARDKGEKVDDSAEEKLSKVKNFITIAKMGFELYKDIMRDKERIERVRKAIEDLQSGLIDLKAYQELIYDLLIPMCKDVEDDIIRIIKELNDKSHAALDLTKWQIQTTLKDLQMQMKQMTEGFKVEGELQRNIENLSSAMSYLIQIYDRIQTYYDYGKLADYIGDVNSQHAVGIPITDPALKKAVTDLDIMIKSNIILEQYHRIMSVFKQYVFPFASYHLEDITLPDDLEVSKDIPETIGKAVECISKIRDKLIEGNSTIHDEYDQYIAFAKFYSKYPVIGPFYVWTSNQYKYALSKLLDAEEVIFKADILKRKDMNAIKFNIIDMNLKTINETMQTELDDNLKSFHISATHLGDSYYRCDDKFYLITHAKQRIRFSFQKDENGDPVSSNNVYKKLKNGDFLLSPYTLWSVKLINTTINGFDELKKFKNLVNLELEGHGQYVIQDDANICEVELKNYYKEDDTLIKLNYAEEESSKEIDDIKKELNITKNAWMNHIDFDELQTNRIIHKNAIRLIHKSGKLLKKLFSESSVLETGIDIIKRASPSARSKQFYNANETISKSYSKFEVNSTLALADFFIRKFTKVKPQSNKNMLYSFLEAKACAMNLVSEFEKVLTKLIKKHGVTVKVDILKLISDLERELIKGNIRNIKRKMFHILTKEKRFSKDVKSLKLLEHKIKKCLSG